MNYYIFIRPIIGAGIGYITNWIAVKMLFRPLNPVKIGKFTLPFTPGIIPRNKEKLAIAIGESISNNLLTEEALRETLLSEEKEAEIKQSLINALNRYVQENNEETIKDLLISYVPEEKVLMIKETVSNNITNSIYTNIKDAKISELISQQIQKAAAEKMKKSLLGMLGGSSIVSSLGPEITEQIDDYLDNNGKELIGNIVNNEINKLEDKKVSGIIEKSNMDFISTIMDIYEKVIINKLPSLLEKINISKIVSEKINSMPTLELEKLILEIMKKELNALVNLGALIGFILGLLNLLF